MKASPPSRGVFGFPVVGQKNARLHFANEVWGRLAIGEHVTRNLKIISAWQK